MHPTVSGFLYSPGLLILLFGYVFPPLILAQSRSDTTTLDDDIEAILEYAAEAERSNAEELVHDLMYLADHPLNLNTSSVQEFLRLPALTPLFARRIVRFREVFGPFTTVDELRAVEGFSRELVAALRPYVQAASASSDSEKSSSQPSTASLHGQLIQRIGRRLERSRGYSATSTSGPVYRGSPYRVTTRARFRYGKTVEANLTLDKDPAEPFEWSPSDDTYGFDFWSSYLSLKPTDGPLKIFLVGDYLPVFGRGLALARSSARGVSGRRPVRSVVTRSTGLKPYRSTGENRFFRGAAATFEVPRHFQITAFASRRSVDASLKAAPGTDDLAVTRRVSDGLHRTRYERARRGALGETVVGGALEWAGDESRWGIAGYHASFTHPFRAGFQPYQRYDMEGRTADMVSLYGEFLLGPSHWFGEAARAPGGAVGSTGGVDVELIEGFEAVALLRHYPRAFTSLYGRGRLQNETGLYTAVRLRRLDRWDVSAAFDQFWHPWLRYNINRPTTGYAGTLSTTYRPQPDIEVRLRFRSRITERQTTFEDRSRVLRGVAPALRQTLRLHGEFRLNEKWRLRTRLELSRARTGSSPDHTGSLLYQDLRWSPTASVQFDGRIAFFSTGHYAARLYAYERDLLYSFTVPAMHGRGQRLYLMANWKLRRGVTLRCKYAVSRYLDRTSIGSGRDEVRGNRLREARLQLRVRW